MQLNEDDLSRIERLIEACDGSARQAAAKLGISESCLSRYRARKLAPSERTIGWFRAAMKKALRTR